MKNTVDRPQNTLEFNQGDLVTNITYVHTTLL